MRPVSFGEALLAGTRLALFSDDKAGRFFMVIKFWMDETSGVAALGVCACHWSGLKAIIGATPACSLSCRRPA